MKRWENKFLGRLNASYVSHSLAQVKVYGNYSQESWPIKRLSVLTRCWPFHVPYISPIRPVNNNSHANALRTDSTRLQSSSMAARSQVMLPLGASARTKRLPQKPDREVLCLWGSCESSVFFRPVVPEFWGGGLKTRGYLGD